MTNNLKNFYDTARKNKWVRLLFLYAVFIIYALFASRLLGTACPIKLVTGISCPSCGMTRANLAFLSFHFEDAFRLHPLFLLGDAAFLVPVLLTAKPSLSRTKTFTVLALLIVAAFISVYIVRMIILFPDTPPLEYFWNSIAGRIIRFF